MKRNLFLAMPALVLAWGIALTGCDLTPEEVGITDFKFPGIGAAGIISGSTISVTVPYDTDRRNLVPSISISPSSATISPRSGVAQNFTGPVKYTVTRAAKYNSDGKQTTPRKDVEYVVTVTWASGSNTETPVAITDFKFVEIGAAGVINNNDRTISVDVPDGTDLRNLVPWISLSPSSATVSPGSGVAQNFTGSVKYTVTREALYNSEGKEKSSRKAVDYLVMVRWVSSSGNGNGGDAKYKIGDTGPAGGLIFYVKSTSSGGWRYLEAAPASTESTVMWGYNVNITGTNTGIGAGKPNTAAIMAYQTRTGTLCLAAMGCDELSEGGFNDWFLPSRDELMLMYTNLKSKGLGGFGNGWYWSSSETGSSGAWNQRFSDGKQEYSNKSDSLAVRAVRAFE